MAHGQPGGRSRALGPRTWATFWSADNGTIFRPGCPTASRHDKFCRDHLFTFPMKFRLLGAGVILAASVLAPQQAHALVATTTYLPFKLFQNPAFNTPATLDFASFTSLVGTGLNLTGVGFKIAGNADGTGSAMVGGNPRVSNSSETEDLQAFISYAPKWTIASLIGGATGSPVGPVTASAQNATPNPVNCVATQTCPGMGGNMIPLSSLRTLNLQGTYNGSGGFASINNTWSGPAAGNGVRLTNGSANFTGGVSGDLLYTFDPTVAGSVAAKPFIMGFVAVQYDYNNPNIVPGPLPLFGAAAAFGWSRRLRKRVSSAA